VVQTVRRLPDVCMSKVDMTINDLDFEVMARNTMLLLYVLSSLDETHSTDETDVGSIAEALIHLWYSAFLTVELNSNFRLRVLPFFTEVCEKTKNEKMHATIEKTWKFTIGCTVRLVLRREQWIRLSQYFKIPESISQEAAHSIRTATVLAPERVDYRDRWHYKDLSPPVRVAKQRFREDGLLIPFGYSRGGFVIPNPYELLGQCFERDH
jgi:hypothetical protein